LFWIPLLALHECGHAFVASLLGWRVETIVIGMGRVLFQFRMGRTNVEVRLIPVEGFVRSAPTRLRLPRLENALIYFAGPGVELLLAFCILLAIGSDRLFTLTDDYQLIIWQSLALAATSQAVLNLIPFAVDSHGRTLLSDGLGIIHS